MEVAKLDAVLATTEQSFEAVAVERAEAATGELPGADIAEPAELEAAE